MKFLTKIKTFFKLIDIIKGTYEITKNGINVDGDIFLSGEKIDMIPFKFNIVTGNFNCSHNNLVSLKNSPREVGGYFICSNNKLVTLEGSPNIVNGTFDASNNMLINLNGSPKKIGDTFYCSHNNLKSFEGCPEIINGSFYIYGNKFEKLKGFPKKCGFIYHKREDVNNLDVCNLNYNMKLNFNINDKDIYLDFTSEEYYKLNKITKFETDSLESISNSFMNIFKLKDDYYYILVFGKIYWIDQFYNLLKLIKKINELL